MRLALLSAIAAFAIGVWLADLIGLAAPLATRATALVAIGFAAFARRRTRAGFALVAAGLLGAGALASALERAAAPLVDTRTMVIDARVAEREQRAGRILIRADDVHAAGAEVPASVQLWIDRDSALAEIPRGRSFRAAVDLERPREASNPGGASRGPALARRGIGAVGKLHHPAMAIVTASALARSGVRDAIDRVRNRAAGRLNARGQGGSLLAALALGDRSGLSPEIRAAAARSGLAHLLAVSGLHLALVAGAAALIFGRWLRFRTLSAQLDARRIGWGAALFTGVGYAVLTGLPVSMQRASVFLAVLAVAGMLRRAVLPAQRLALAGGVVLLAEPAVLFEPGAQLSFSATAALILAPQVREASDTRWRSRAAQLLGTCAAASLATAPIAAFHFGTASSLGWLANLLAIPITACALLPLALVSAAIESVGLVSLAFVIDFSVGFAEACLAATRAWADWQPAAGFVKPGGLGLSGSAALACWGLARSRLRWRALAAILSGAVLSWAPVAALEPTVPRVVFLDVGWGDAIVVQGRSASILVDTGGAFENYDAGRSVVLPALARLGISRLDALVVTHRDRDHSGGALSVLAGIPTSELWLPFGAGSDPALTRVREAASLRSITVRELGASSAPIVRGDLSVTPVWPLATSRSGGNDDSLVLRVVVEDRVFLLTGDLEEPGERALLAGDAVLSADVLKLGHHGSRTSSHGAFLRAVAPEWTIVSAPRAGRLAFPHASVLDRVAALEFGLAWTGRDGAVLVGISPFSVSSWQRGRLELNSVRSDTLQQDPRRKRNGHRPRHAAGARSAPPRGCRAL